MKLVEAISTVGATTRGRRNQRLGIAVAVAAVVIAMPLFTGSATADPVGDAQAQAAKLASQIATGAARIHQLTAVYGLASDRASIAAAQLAHAEAEIQRSQARVNSSRALLRVEAVNAYVSNGNGSAGLATRSGRPTTGSAAIDALVGREYLTVATGDVADTVDQLRLGLQVLRSDESNLRDSERLSSGAAGQVSRARQAALAEAAREQATLGQVQGQLVALVAAAEAAQTASAARAAAAAAARTASGSGPTASSAPPATARPSAPQGLPVNGGLVALVAAQTSAPPPAPAPTPAHTPAPAPTPARTPAPAPPVGPHPGGSSPPLARAGAGGWQQRRRVGRAAPMRVRRKLCRKQRERVFRRLSVQPGDLVGPRLSRPARSRAGGHAGPSSPTAAGHVRLGSVARLRRRPRTRLTDSPARAGHSVLSTSMTAIR